MILPMFNVENCHLFSNILLFRWN